MFCFKCGSPRADDSRLCPKCGTPVQTAPPAAPPPPVSSYPPSAPALSGPVRQFVPRSDERAVISLVLGIMALVSTSILTGIPAIILGSQARKKIRASSGQLTGEGMATAGMVMGWVSVGLAGVFLLLFLAMMVYLIPSGR